MWHLSRWYFTSLRDGYREGYITKEEYACTLRENQASCDNMKSDNREKEKEIFDMFNLLGLGQQGDILYINGWTNYIH